MGLKQLVDACHAKGLAVLLDVVYNHFGPSGNYLPRFGPYLTDRYAHAMGQRGQLRRPGQRRGAPPGVRQRLVLDARLPYRRPAAGRDPRDRGRLAVANTRADWRRRPRSWLARPDVSLVLIAENDLNDPRVVTVPVRGGYGIDAQWNDDFHHSLHTVLTGEKNGYYSDFGMLAVSSPRRCGTPSSTTVNTRHTATGVMGGRRPDCRATTSSGVCKTTTR